MLLQAVYSIRSERQLMERLEFDLLFRWFVGLGVDDPAWDNLTAAVSQRRGWWPRDQLGLRKRIEEAFGWINTVAGQDKTRFTGEGFDLPSPPPTTISSASPDCSRRPTNGEALRLSGRLRRSSAVGAACCPLRESGWPHSQPPANPAMFFNSLLVKPSGKE
jgi:hypothetical protein